MFLFFFVLFSFFIYIAVETPIRIKRIIVEKHEIMKRWKEEISLVKKEMANFIFFYVDLTIPQLSRTAQELQGKLDS